jgi:hypothetical protein
LRVLGPEQQTKQEADGRLAAHFAQR